MELSVEYLNHASVLLRTGKLRLLSDPWFEGTAFSGGWGLRYHNPDALDAACNATHLWISHWHGDHFHVGTLQALARRNPELVVLANSSANFCMAERMRGLGFRHVLELGERTPLEIETHVHVTRYPTAGIDNMLHVRAPGWSILNYNDCNLRPSAARALRDKIGAVDVLLTNYNHAGKLFEARAPELEKQALWRALSRTIDLFSPRRVVPFASSHYYRVSSSRPQNASLLDFEDLQERAAWDPRFLILRVGDRAQLPAAHLPPRLTPREPRLPKQPEIEHDYGPSVPWEELVRTANARCDELSEGFPLLNRFVKPLVIEVSDQGRRMQLDLRSGARELGRAPAHIAAHSRALHDWLSRPFGDDSFVAGAHFGVASRDLGTIRLWVALSLLHSSQLSVRDALGYLRTREGLRFFWCRREEILSTLAAGSVRAGEMRG
jgi:L-ascorbate metabolism protein UlaG (beta-lactamase superfamily)